MFFVCPRFKERGSKLEAIVKGMVTPDNLIGIMLSSRAPWDATGLFVTEVLKELRRQE